MTPQEKAKELVDRYLQYVEAFSSKQQDENAKQCALIAVDEVITESMNNEYSEKYWTEVKQEIEKL